MSPTSHFSLLSTGFVQFLQYYYQSGCLYRLRALGERNQLDLTVGKKDIFWSVDRHLQLMATGEKGSVQQVIAPAHWCTIESRFNASVQELKCDRLACNASVTACIVSLLSWRCTLTPLLSLCRGLPVLDVARTHFCPAFPFFWPCKFCLC